MSCPRCPHCLAAGAFGLIASDDPALAPTGRPKKLHKIPDQPRNVRGEFAVCGVYSFRYRDRRSGSGVDAWSDVTCPACLKLRPPEKKKDAR